MTVLRIDDADGVRLCTLARPDALNAFNDELWDALRDALDGARTDPAIRCVVVTGEGRAFSAGQDLSEMAAPPEHPDGGEKHGYRAFIPVLEEFDKVLIAAVNGIGVGIGMTFLPYCDLVLMAEGARVKVPFLTLGVTTEAASSYLLPARMGWQAAAHAVFTASWVSAEDAVASNLAWKVVAPDALLDETMVVARQIGAMPVNALQTTKRLMVAGRLDAARAARRREDDAFIGLVGTPENLAALEAFFAPKG